MPSLLDIAALVIPLIMGMAVGYSLRGRKIFNTEKVTLGIIYNADFLSGFFYRLKL
jgi:hypothetical protein